MYYLLRWHGFFFLAGLAPSLKLVSVGPKLRRPEFDDIRPRMERNLRLFVLVIGVFVFFAITLRLVEDVGHLCVGEKPAQVTAAPQSVSTIFGAWYLVQFVNLGQGKRMATLLYSSKLLQKGRNYEFVVLPRSQILLAFHEIP